MKDGIEYGFRSRLEEGEGVEYKIVFTERILKAARLLRMDIIGSEADLRTYYDEWCADCAVRNTTTGLVPLIEGDNSLLSYSCVVDKDHERVRLCDLSDCYGPDEDEDDFEVPEDNWYGIGSNDMDELYEEAVQFSGRKVGVVEEVVMRRDPDFEIVITRRDNEVVLSGRGLDVLDYWQNLCSVCSANADKDEEDPTLPDFSNSQFITINCCPKAGSDCFRVCDITKFI